MNVSKAKLFHLGASAAALALLCTLATSAPAQVCISPKAKAALPTDDNPGACPKGKLKSNVARKPQVSFSSAPEALKKKKRQNNLRPVNPTEMTNTAQRDERAARLKPKVRTLLLTEIRNVERLYRSTPKRDKDRPRLMRRLAEGYVELESSAFRDKVTSEIKAQDLKRSNPKLAAKFKKKAKVAKRTINVGRKNAIKYYKKLKSQYPKWCQFPKKPAGQRGCMDEVLYYLAYEYEQAKDLENARKAYLELTENWKKSRYIPNAYLAFGELFFNEAQGDPSRWPIAANFYGEVLKFSPPENKLWGYAAYKIAYVHWNMGEYAKAIDYFKDVINFGMKFASLPNAKGLAKSARRDIIPVYALKGKPDQAYKFFKPLSGDKGVGSMKTFKMMEDLGQNLIDTGHYKEAIVLYNDLMKRNKGKNHCFYQAQVSQAVMASQSGNKRPIVAALKNQMKVYKDYDKKKYSARNKLKCANTSAALMTETAMAWHLEAVGSGGVRGTGAETTMSLSTELYELVVGNFTSAQFKSFKFPRIVREDWPTIAKIRYAMADLMYFRKDWAKCGPAFDAVVAEDPSGPNAAEAAFASVLCYQNIYATKHAKDGGRKGIGGLDKKKGKSKKNEFVAQEFTDEQKGMIRAFNRYVCYIKPPKGNAEALEQYVDVKYARARTFFEAKRWEEAAWAFRDVAINHSKLDAALYAAQLYLESLNIMASRVETPKASCLDHMAEDVPKFIESFCSTSEQKEENKDQCSILFRIQRDIESKQAEALVKQADKGGSNRIELYEKAAKLYYKVWQKYGEKPCAAYGSGEKEQKANCVGKNEKILYNAARAFQAARLIAKAIQVRRILISDKYGLKNTEPAKRAVYEIGGNYQAIAVYDKAASWYEKFANENPKMKEAPDALSDAVVLRLGLGQHEKAIQGAATFNLKYGRKSPIKAARIAFAIGSYYAEKQEWKKAERALSRNLRSIDAKATVDVKIQAHALAGRIAAALNKVAQADREYNKVRASIKTFGKVRADLAKEAGGARRYGKVLTAAGEALFYFAEKTRKKADKFAFPKFKGKREKKEINEFVKEKVKKWYQEKKKAIAAAEADYLKVLKLQPPPPRWVIASGAAVGNMWGRFVAEFLTAPYPKQWDDPGVVPGTEPPLYWQELRASYQAGLAGAAAPFKTRARGAYQKCLAYSVTYQYFDKDSRSCEEWLSKNFPAEFHLIDEFRGSANRINSGLDERPQVLQSDGTPVLVDTRKAEEKASQKDAKAGK